MMILVHHEGYLLSILSYTGSYVRLLFQIELKNSLLVNYRADNCDLVALIPSLRVPLTKPRLGVSQQTITSYMLTIALLQQRQ